jgi:hypothetical protein
MWPNQRSGPSRAALDVRASDGRSDLRYYSATTSSYDL